MFDIAQYDIVGISALIAVLVFIGGLLLVLVDDQPMEELNERWRQDDAPAARDARVLPMADASGSRTEAGDDAPTPAPKVRRSA